MPCNSVKKKRSLPQYRHDPVDLLVSVSAFCVISLASQVMLLMYIAAVTGMELIKVDPELPTEHPCDSLTSRARVKHCKYISIYHCYIYIIVYLYIVYI